MFKKAKSCFVLYVLVVCVLLGSLFKGFYFRIFLLFGYYYYFLLFVSNLFYPLFCSLRLIDCHYRPRDHLIEDDSNLPHCFLIFILISFSKFLNVHLILNLIYFYVSFG